MHYTITFTGTAAEYRTLIHAVAIVILSEIAIDLFALAGRMGKKSKQQTRTSADKGTCWLLIIAWYLIVGAYYSLRSNSVPRLIQTWLLSHAFLYVGIILIAVGIVIRYTAVFTLKRAFTLSVQTASGQHLIQTGLYRIVRNPSYTGSIITLLGLGIAFRNILGIFLIIPFSLCYAVRIKVEETALQAHFQAEFTDYCRKTKYRLLPRIY